MSWLPWFGGGGPLKAFQGVSKKVFFWPPQVTFHSFSSLFSMWYPYGGTGGLRKALVGAPRYVGRAPAACLLGPATCLGFPSTYFGSHCGVTLRVSGGPRNEILEVVVKASGALASKFRKKEGVAEFRSEFPGLITSDFKYICGLFSGLHMSGFRVVAVTGLREGSWVFAGSRRMRVSTLCHKTLRRRKYVEKEMGHRYCPYIMIGTVSDSWKVASSSMQMWLTLTAGLPHTAVDIAVEMQVQENNVNSAEGGRGMWYICCRRACPSMRAPLGPVISKERPSELLIAYQLLQW